MHLMNYSEWKPLVNFPSNNKAFFTGEILYSSTVLLIHNLMLKILKNELKMIPSCVKTFPLLSDMFSCSCIYSFSILHTSIYILFKNSIELKQARATEKALCFMAYIYMPFLHFYIGNTYPPPSPHTHVEKLSIWLQKTKKISWISAHSWLCLLLPINNLSIVKYLIFI